MNPAEKPTAAEAAQFAKPDTSDSEDLKGRVMACLQDRNADVRGIHLTVFGGTVAIRGYVRSLKEKRLCVECCRHVPGVMRVVDDLIVAEEMRTS
jgi:osmotically-inducible protein OsmY